VLRTGDWGARLKQLAGGEGVRVIIEIGGGESFTQSLRAAALGGVIVLIGVVAGGEARVQLTSILMRHLRVQGIVVGSRKVFEDMNKTIQQHELRPVIDRVYPFEKAPEALQYLKTGGHFGKVCLNLA
jgi:NADPH:quinone reductase-like Zn-dependent oxidoreductase